MIGYTLNIQDEILQNKSLRCYKSLKCLRLIDSIIPRVFG